MIWFLIVVLAVAIGAGVYFRVPIKAYFAKEKIAAQAEINKLKAKL